MPSQNWGRQGQLKESKKETSLKDKLKAMSMSELREFAKENNLEAKDTNKKELIEEIIEELQ